MKKYNKWNFAVVLLLILFISGIVFFNVKQYIVVVGKDKTLALEEKTELPEEIEVKIIDNESQNQLTENKNEEIVAEEGLESDAEQLTVTEDPEDGIVTDVNTSDSLKKFPALTPPTEQNNNSNELKIGFVSDLHAMSTTSGNERLLKEPYMNKMNYFVEKMNNVFIPNFIILNGDMIEGTRISSAVGSKELSLVKNLLDRTVIEKYWSVGNHDLRSITKKQWMKVLGINYLYKSFEVGNYKIIILDSNFAKDDSDVCAGNRYTQGKVSEKELKWLKAEVKDTDKKVIVFMHHPPLTNNDMDLNVELLSNAEDVQNIFSQYGVKAVFAGHIEDLYYKEINGVDYINLPGIGKNPKYQGAFAEITVKGSKLTININYLKEDGTYRVAHIEKNSD